MTSTPKCSSEMAQKVGYEFRMFAFLFAQLRYSASESDVLLPGEMVELGTSQLAPDERLGVFAQLESFLLHARVLRDFFFRKPKFDDDVVAEHFLPDWSAHRASLGPYLTAHELRLNKALAHLTTMRLDYDKAEKKWEVSTIRDELQPVIDSFLSKLPRDRQRWFDYTTEEPN